MATPSWGRAAGHVLQTLRESTDIRDCPTCGDATSRRIRQSDVAGLLGVSQGTVSNFETARTNPSPPELETMLRHFRTSVSTFWELVDDEGGSAV
jgi:DNA-binding XRE family transcriptional regulator